MYRRRQIRTDIKIGILFGNCKRGIYKDTLSMSAAAAWTKAE